MSRPHPTNACRLQPTGSASKTSEPTRGDAGFTLLEVLAAVAIAGLALSAIASVVSVTLAGIRSAPDRVALVEVGRTMLSSLVEGEALKAGTTTGLIGTTRWRVDVTPMPQEVRAPGASRAATLSAADGQSPDGSQQPGAPPAAPAWRPAAVALTATSREGLRLRLDTVALIRPTPP